MHKGNPKGPGEGASLRLGFALFLHPHPKPLLQFVPTRGPRGVGAAQWAQGSQRTEFVSRLCSSSIQLTVLFEANQERSVFWVNEVRLQPSSEGRRGNDRPDLAGPRRRRCGAARSLRGTERGWRAPHPGSLRALPAESLLERNTSARSRSAVAATGDVHSPNPRQV